MALRPLCALILPWFLVWTGNAFAADFCGLNLCDVNANCNNPADSFASGCECNSGWAAENAGSWFDGNCYFESGSYPAVADETWRTNASEHFEIGQTLLQNDAIFVSKIVFPTTAQDGVLVQIGGARIGLWVGILDGKFHIQAGKGGTLYCGMRYPETAYLITDLYPLDGQAHTVIIDFELTNEGRIQLWIDGAYIGEGVHWSSGQGTAWAQSGHGAYGLPSTTQGVVAVDAAWPGDILSDLVVYSDSPRMGGCIAITCLDIRVDECKAEQDDCHSAASCSDTAGSFTCSCNAGYSGNGTECLNIDECATSGNGCHTLATCHDTLGSYFCTCNAGYAKDGSVGDETCFDIDECLTNTNDCDLNATCSNIAGSFTCACNVGFLGSGIATNDSASMLEGLSAIFTTAPAENWNSTVDFTLKETAASFYVKTTSSSLQTETPSPVVSDGCADVDECAAGDHNCDSAHATCVNTIGSFICTCHSGWDSFDDGVSCTDAVECGVSDNCDANAACADANGSFTCSCNEGFSGNGTVDGCFDVDECTGHHNCDAASATCNNTIGSFSCTCDAGWESNNGGVVCTDVVDCGVSDNCHSNSVCADADGSFTCTCNAGWASLSEGGSWFEGNCFFENYTYPSPSLSDVDLRRPASSNFNVKKGIRLADTIFVCKVVFPTTTEDAMLFEIGGVNGLWVGVINGTFHIQVGEAKTPVVDGVVYDETAYIRTNDFPTDGLNHTIVIDLELSFQGKLRLWIDASYIGDGVQWTSTTKTFWAGRNNGAYGVGTTTIVPVGLVRTGWMGAVSSDLLIYSSTQRVGGCVSAQCLNIDECATSAHTCDANAVCDDTEGSFTCACNIGWEYSDLGWFEEGCAFDDGIVSPALASAKRRQVPSDAVALSQSIRMKDVVFSCEVVFPFTVQDGLLFELGGSFEGAWAGILNGKFHFQAGAGDTAVNSEDGTYPSTAYLITESFPADNKTHTVLIDFEFSNFGRTRLWIDNDYIGEGVRMTSHLQQWAGTNIGAYGLSSSSPVVVGATGSGWSGAIVSDLVIYSEMRVASCQRCVDIDECLVGSHNCDVNGECTDIDGSFSCACTAGWGGNGTFCINIDECDAGLDTCHDNATCSDTDGSFVCACDGPHWLDTGFSGGTSCEMDECAMEVDNCDALAQCNNTNGSFTCTCSTGFTAQSPMFDGSACADIDECSDGTHECDPNAACSNINGSYTCECTSGWQSGSWFEGACLYADGSYPDVETADFRTAEAVELRLPSIIRRGSAIFACKAVFPSTVQDGRLFVLGDWSFKIWVGILDGRFRIQVGTAYQAISDGAQANNAAYMITDAFPKDDKPHTVLIDMDNTNKRAISLWFDNEYIGEGVPQRWSSTGYAWAGSSTGGAYGNVSGGVGMSNHPNVSTSPWPGAIWSDLIIHQSSKRVGGCKEGACGNVDECADTLHNCGAGATCADNPGSFSCGCNTGYGEWAITNVSCADVDECNVGSHICHAQATCANTDGSYNCPCNAGWTAASWFHGSCWFSDGTYPDLALSDVTLRMSESSSLDVASSIRSSPVIFVCRVTFSTVVQNGRLFAIGVDFWKLWVGILDGQFRIQAGRSNHAISEGVVADNAAYLTTDAFPRDGLDHTLVIDVDPNSYGRIQLWIDNVYVGEGVLSKYQQIYKGWGGNGPGIYGSESGGPSMSNKNGSTDGWPGKVLSDLMIYSNTKRVGGCDERVPQCTANVDECAAELHNCEMHASCSDTVGSFTCTCDVGYSGIGDSSCIDIDECTDESHQCDANARCSNNNGSHTCECVDGWQQATWFEGNCFFEDGSHPDLSNANSTLLFPSSSEFEVDRSVRQLSTIFACKVVFPTTTEDAMLFEIGGDFGDGGIWAGVLGGKFHVQAGDEHPVDDSSNWADTAWVRSDLFPHDGKAHTVLIDLDWRHGGWMRVWIDSTLIGEGRLAFAVRRWAGHDPGAFGMTTASDVVVGAAFNGWNGSVLSDLMLYVNATKRVSGCDANLCANVDECAAELHNCVTHASCSDTVGSFSCSCDAGYTGVGDSSCVDVDECVDGSHTCDANARCHNTQGNYTCECILESWFEGNCFFENGIYPLDNQTDATMQIPVSSNFDVDVSVRTSDAVFVCKVVFPQTTEDAMLFEIGGRHAIWVGVLHGSFHIQAGTPQVLVVNGSSHAETAYMIIDDFPRDGLPHTVVIDLELSAQGRIRLWFDNAYRGEGVPWEATKSKWAGGNKGAFGVATSTKVPFGTVGTGWMGMIVSDLVIYAGAARVGGCGQDAGCVNVDECALGVDNCGSSANCSDTAGSFACICAVGWSISDDHGECVNVDECASGWDTCGNGTTCSDTDGSFVCVRDDDNAQSAASLEASAMRVEEVEGSTTEPTANTTMYLGIASVVGVIIMLGVVRWHLRRRRQHSWKPKGWSDVCFAQATETNSVVQKSVGTTRASDQDTRSAAAESELSSNPRATPQLEWKLSRSNRLSSKSLAVPSPLSFASALSPKGGGSFKRVFEAMRKPSRASADAYDVASGEGLLVWEGEET